jgi:hypothetical protein
MVNKLFMFFAYVIFFTLALMYFTPKASLYYMLEKELKKYDVILSGETVSDNGFSLSLENSNVYVKDIQSAQVKDANIKLFALYNSIHIQGIVLSDVAGTFLPLEIKNTNIVYSIFDPLNVNLNSKGDFGSANGSFNLVDKKLHLDVMPSDTMKRKYRNSMRQLKKQKDGSYSYDKTF